MLRIQSPRRRAYCRVDRLSSGWRCAAKRNSSWLPVCDAEVFINRLAGLFGDLEPYRPAGFLLADRRSLNGVPVRGDVLDFESDDIATAQLAVDGEIEQRQVALAVCHLELGADRPDVFWPERRFGSGQLALVPRDALRGGLIAFCMVVLLVGENDQHGLNSGSFARQRHVTSPPSNAALRKEHLLRYLSGAAGVGYSRRAICSATVGVKLFDNGYGAQFAGMQVAVFRSQTRCRRGC